MDRIGRVSRLMAKARRDNGPHIVSGGDTVWKTVTTGEMAYRGQARNTQPGWRAHYLTSFGLQGPHRRERAWKSTLTYQCTFVATRELPISPLRRWLAWAVSRIGRAQWP